MRGFRETLETYHLGDLDFSGSMFTWCNRRTNRTFTKERLDRAVANPEWCAIFPIFFVLILAAGSSDHSPLLVSFFGCNSVGRHKDLSEGVSNLRLAGQMM